MKVTTKWKLLFLLLAPLFINGLCNHDDDDLPLPNTNEYVTWNIPGHSGQLTVPPDSLSMVRWGNLTVIFGTSNTSANADFYASFPGPQSPGNYSMQDFLVTAGNNSYVPTATPLQVNVTEYGPIGGYITGSYSGVLRDSMSTTTYGVTGNFRVKNR